MFEGGCFCGAIRIKSTGEIRLKGLCHCTDCRKITGSLFSTNIIVDSDGFSVTKGTPKVFATQGGSGKTMTSYFCGDCGTTVWREGEAFGDTKVLKAGTLDGENIIEVDSKPAVEIFVARRPSWLPPIEGVQTSQYA